MALRYHNVYGRRMPRDTPYAGVAALFRSALARGVAPRVYEDGGQLRDFVHVRDVASANLLALERTTRPPAGSRRTTWPAVCRAPSGRLAEALSDAVGGPRPVVTGEFRSGDVRHVVASRPGLRLDSGSGRGDVAAGMADFAAEGQGLTSW